MRGDRAIIDQLFIIHLNDHFRYTDNTVLVNVPSVSDVSGLSGRCVGCVGSDSRLCRADQYKPRICHCISSASESGTMYNIQNLNTSLILTSTSLLLTSTSLSLTSTISRDLSRDLCDLCVTSELQLLFSV